MVTSGGAHHVVFVGIRCDWRSARPHTLGQRWVGARDRREGKQGVALHHRQARTLERARHDEAGAVGFAPTEDLKQIDGFQSRSQLRVGANALG